MCILGRNVLSQWQLFLWVYMLNINCVVLFNQTVESETSSNLLPYFLFRKKITDSLTSIILLWLFWSLSCKFSQIWGNLIGTVSKGIGFFVLEKKPQTYLWIATSWGSPVFADISCTMTADDKMPSRYLGCWMQQRLYLKNDDDLF